MKDASQYPITELYGCQPGYPLNQNLCPPGQGFHRGIDYGCPSGTPIIVNGVEIGLSGATGAVTGPHLHVGRWIGGESTDPGVGNGFHFNSAVVAEVNEDPTNGKYVRVQGDDASWVYLHMSDNNKVSVGQVLQGDEMSYPNNGDLVNIHNETGWPGHDINTDDVAYWCSGTNNPHWGNANDVWTALAIEVAKYTDTADFNFVEDASVGTLGRTSVGDQNLQNNVGSRKSDALR